MNVFEIGAKIGLDSKAFVSGLNSASGAVSSFASKTKDVLGGVAKVATASIGAASAGIAALTKQAVSAYADYEQLVGGVEKLFGESSDLLMSYAKDAYKTAGLSVNEYMEIATGFAAALTTSVKAAGGSMDEAVELADTAMQDMSDNANTFGTDMSSIQSAYQGFAKQNYSMLDNLKLGYGGTKTEMERLIEDANKLRHEQGINNDLTIESYADVITAIHTVQVEMGIFNTTEKEAARTISGSIGMAKSAWKNLITEIGKDDGNIAESFKILQESIATVGENVLPRVEQTLSGISDLIVTSAPQITRAITKLLPKILPQVIKSASQLVSGIGTTLLDSIPELLDTGRNLLANLTYGMVTADVDGGGILSNLLDSIVNEAPYYMQYAQMIISHLANRLLNADYEHIGSAIHDLIVSGINSITDFVKGIDFAKLGEDIAMFLNALDFDEIATEIFELLGTAIKNLPDLAESFFKNADIGNLMGLIAAMGAPKLFGSIAEYAASAKGVEQGQAAGLSWASAFLIGIQVFNLAYKITDYLLDNVKIGGKSLREIEIDYMTRDIPDEESEFDTAGNTGWINYNGKLIKVDPNSEIYKRYNPSGYNDWLKNHAMTEDEYADYMASNDYKVTNQTDDTLVPRVAGDVAGQEAKNLQARPATKHNTETFRYIQNGVIQSAFKYDEYNQLSEAWKKYGGIAFGDGGRVTRPTFALVGEKEPETIIPDSKRGEFGNTYNTEVHIHIDGTGKNADEIADEAIEIVSSKLSFLGITQQRAVGGKSWQ